MEQEKKVIGLKQSMRAIERGNASYVYIAKNAKNTLIQPVIDICKEKGIEIRYTENKKELGLSNGIGVAAAVVCILK